MATRSCPQCSTQYVASVRRCIDCDVMLVDDATGDGEGEVTGSVAAPLGDGDQIAYELEGWGNQLKVTLEGMLVRAEIKRVWEAGALVVSAADEEVVDELIATLEGGDADELPEGDEQIAFEIEGLHADDLAELDARLIAESVPHAWDEEGALLVAVDDEDRVSAIIDEVIAGVDEEGDGLDAQQLLSDLFVATDKLVHRPADRKHATGYVVAESQVADLPLPYGFSGDDWSSLLAEAAAVRAQVTRWADLDALAPDEDQDDADADADADESDVAAVDVAAVDVAEDEAEDVLGETADAPAADDDADVVEGEPAEPDASADPDDDADADQDDADADQDDEVDPVEQARAAASALRTRLLDYV